MRRLTRDRDCGDGGFTLIECLVACLVLMILSSAVFGVLVTATRATRSDTARVGASQLGARELEIWRQAYTTGDDSDRATIEGTSSHDLDSHDTDGTALTPGTPVSVGGIAYTVMVTITPLLTGTGKSNCDGGSLVAHPAYELSAQVTWPNMGVVAPVTDTTVLTPPKSTASDPVVGYIAVALTDSRSNAVASQQISIAGPGGNETIVTDSAGCAVDEVSQAGSYAATVDVAGYVDASDATVSTKSIQVALGSLAKVQMSYDKASTLDLSFSQPAGYVLPQPLPMLTMADTEIQPAGIEYETATGTTTVLQNLWSFPAGYAIWAGSCADADPAQPPTSGSRAPATVVAAGTTANVTVSLASVDIVLTDSDGDPVSDTTVTATKPATATAGCQADGTLTLGTTDSNGHLGALMPDGSWQLSASASATANLAVTGAPASVTMVQS